MMTGKPIKFDDVVNGVYGPFVRFGEEFDAMATARELRNLVTEPSIENVSQALELEEYKLNVLLIGRVPDEKHRAFIVKAITEVMAHAVLRVIYEYEGASRSLRVEASHEAAMKKGENSQAVTWNVINEFINQH